MANTAEPPGAAALASDLTGPLLPPHSSGYGDEVGAFNAAVNHRPALVVGAAPPDEHDRWREMRQRGVAGLLNAEVQAVEWRPAA